MLHPGATASADQGADSFLPFSSGSAPYCSAQQTQWLQHCFSLATGRSRVGQAQGWEGRRPSSLNGLHPFSLPRGLPPFDSVFEGQQPSCTPGSHLSPSFKDCGGNWQNAASSVRAVEDKDVPGTHLSDECVRVCEAVVVNVYMMGV